VCERRATPAVEASARDASAEGSLSSAMTKL
jgi:hypothetical protein